MYIISRQDTYKLKYLTYILSEIENGVKIRFSKNNEMYEIDITKKSIGHTSMTDYYIFGDMLTYNELIELKRVVNRVETEVAKWDFN